jgi:hypothetical protein
MARVRGSSMRCGPGPQAGGPRGDAERGDHRLADRQDVRDRGERDYNGGKKANGRKRHMLCDTMGLLLAVVVKSATADDGTTAPRFLDQFDMSR